MIKGGRNMKRYRLNKKKFARFLVGIITVGVLTGLAVDVIRFPEWYISTWKYQLQLDIEAGNQNAIEYYENTYIANGRELF